MRRVIEGIPFSDCKVYPCFYAVLDSLLEFYGYPPSWVLHDEWFFLYRGDGGQGIEIATRRTPLPERMRRLGIHMAVHKEPEFSAAWDCVRPRMESGHPVAVPADTHHLEALYYSGTGGHSEHFVILAGFDDSAGTVHVVDPSPFKRFRGDLPLERFSRAWGSDAIEGHRWLDLRTPESRPFHVAGEEALHSIQQNLRAMLAEDGASAGGFTGLRGLRELECDLLKWQDPAARGAAANLRRAFDLLLQVVFEREGHGRYLKLAGEQLRAPDISLMGGRLQLISKEWGLFRNLCFKAQKKALPGALHRLHRRLQGITTLESGTLCRLAKLSASLLTKPTDEK